MRLDAKVLRKSISSPSTADNSSSILISGQIGDILTYNWTTENDSPSFEKYLITNLTTCDLNLQIDYDVFAATNLTSFDTTPTNQTCNTLSGNFTLDLFSNTTIFNFFQPLTLNFTENQGVFTEFEEEANQNDRFRINITIGKYGLSVRIRFYYRILVFVKVMEMELYYSTTRVLLLARMWAMNLDNNDDAEMYCSIVPESSSVIGRFQNPYDPLVEVTNGTIFPHPFGSNDTDSADNVIFDTHAVLVLSGIAVGIGGLFGCVIWFIKKRKKPEII